MVVLIYFFISLLLFLMAIWLGLFSPVVILIIITIGIVYSIRNGLGLGERNIDVKKIVTFSLYIAIAIMWIAHGVGWVIIG